MTVKEITNHNGYYVSQCGKILKEMKPWKTSAGYLHVKLQGKHYDVHRLVGLHFLNKDGDVINHKDLNRKNNHVENLEWISQKENIHHYFKNGGDSIKNFVECILLIDGKEFKECKSIREACKIAEQLGASYSMLNKHMKHKNFEIVKR